MGRSFIGAPAGQNSLGWDDSTTLPGLRGMFKIALSPRE